MARNSVLVMLLAVVLVSACVTVEPAATAPAITSAPSVVPVPTPTPETSLTPTASPEPTLAPTPTPTEEPERTLAPGETPTPSPLDIADFLTAMLKVVNLTDDPVNVSVDIYSEGENQGTVAKADLEPYGSIFQAVPETSYAVTFTRGTADPITCLMAVVDGSEIDFTLVGTDIMVFDPNVEPTTPADLFVETSALCQS
jgi:hypothetical protein